MEYRTYSDLQHIEQMFPEWNRVLAASSCNRTFASLEWFLASCRIRKGAIPYVIVGIRDAAWACIVPLVLDPGDGTATFPHCDNDYNDMLTGNCSHKEVAELLSHVMADESQCSRLLFSRLRPDSRCVDALSFLQLNSGLKCKCREINTYPYIKLPSSFEEYLSTRSKAFRKNVRRVLRKIQADGLALRELLPSEFSPAELPEVLISLALERQKERSFLKKLETQEFVREVLPALFVKRDLRAFALWKEERIVGLDICMVRHNGLLTWNGGFTEQAGGWSPGTGLFAFGIQQAIAMGMQEYEFAEGKERYKESWANARYRVMEIEICSSPSRNRIAGAGADRTPSIVSH